jgi:hypothetical protein
MHRSVPFQSQLQDQGSRSVNFGLVSFAAVRSLFTFPQIAVFNPLGWAIDELVALPVSTAALVVRNHDSSLVPSTVLPADQARSDQIIQNRESSSIPSFTLHFSAAVPPFGFSFFTVSPADHLEESDTPAAHSTPTSVDDTLVDDFLAIQNEYLALYFSSETKLLSAIRDVQRNITLSCSQQLMYYEAEGHLLIDTKHKRCCASVPCCPTHPRNQLGRLRIPAPQQLSFSF